jgi:deoxyribodipyrimidine photolyase-related protein
MTPNVYGMSQFADGGSFATKPYIGASNYIKKMSNFKQGDWCDSFDGLFWRFVDKNKPVFEKNGRMKFLLSTLKRNDYSEKIALAENFLQEKTKKKKNR